MMSTSSLSSGTTSSTKRGIVGTTGGGVIRAAFFALKRNLQIERGYFYIYINILKSSPILLNPKTLFKNLYKPFLLAFLSRGILLVLSIFDGRDLFGHGRFFLLLLLLFATG